MVIAKRAQQLIEAHACEPRPHAGSLSAVSRSLERSWTSAGPVSLHSREIDKVPDEATLFGVIRSVNIRALKDGLSAYLRDVRRGDIVLVTDRGQVIAELRQPTLHAVGMDPPAARLSQLAEAGRVRLGLPNWAGAYGESRLRLSTQSVRDALDWARGEDP
jgi:antitoxin (DNA-binding transcriptional repressor) of toxin-antitoxin stability system